MLESEGWTTREARVAGLPRPEVPPGPRRDLVDALHALHHAAGWPSLRVLARTAGCCHTTVSGVFSEPRLPSWGCLELLVEAMDGDTAASGSSGWPPVRPTRRPRPTRLAGRGRAGRGTPAFEAGAGLHLVTGEAGIGKTRLVTTAAARRPHRLSRSGRVCPCRSTPLCCRSQICCGRRTTATEAAG